MAENNNKPQVRVASIEVELGMSVISLSVIDGILKLSVKKNRYGINNKDVMVMWDINAGYIKPLLENKEGEKGEAEDYGF